MYSFGTIVLARFPFTDLSDAKLRPALVVSHGARRDDVILCFITPSSRIGTYTASIPADPSTELKLPSMVHFDRLGTLNARLIVGRLGQAPAAWLSAQRGRFFAVFGFDV